MRVHVLQFVEKCIRKIRDILLGRFAFRCSSLGLLQTPVPFLEEFRQHRKVRAPEMIGNCESVGKLFSAFLSLFMPVKRRALEKSQQF